MDRYVTDVSSGKVRVDTSRGLCGGVGEPVRRVDGAAWPCGPYRRPMTLPRDFVRRIESLEEAYLRSDDPIRQSGFGGGAERWRAERGPILEAVEGDGDLLDIGCANGYLLECLVAWGG